MSGVTVDDGDLEALVGYVSQRTGLSFVGSRGPWLRGVLARALAKQAGPAAAGVYATNDDALGGLVDDVTVRETYFFREPATLDLLRNEVFPSLRERTCRPVRAWSAGCASGEEAYTLAILLAEAGLAGRAQVIGTDLSAAAVTAARAGIYGRWALRALDAAAVASYFTVERDGFRVREKFRAGVSFQRQNLIEAPLLPPGAFDLVLCRNVLIYLTPDGMARAVRNLVAALAPGGWLLTSASDPLLEGTAGLQTMVGAHGVAYRRCDAAAGQTEVVPDEAPRDGTGSAGRGAWSPVHAPSPGPRTPSERRDERHPPATLTARQTRGSVEDVLAAAQRALDLGSPDRASQLARSVLDVDPDHLAGHRLLVQALGAEGSLAEAIAAAEIAVDAFPLDGHLRHLHAVLLLEQGAAAEAAKAAQRAVYLEPALAAAYLVLARSNEILGKAALAERARRNGRRLLQAGRGR